MVTLLSKIFIRNKGDEQQTRRSYGVLCSVLGICLNIILFGFKYLVGTLSGSIAITADAFNNLSDAGSSVITLVGFKFAGKKADLDHPFGHGRFEYLSGLAVAVIILIMGFELFVSSFKKILSPEPVETSWAAVAVLVGSICVKAYMMFYNTRVGRRIGSKAMVTVARDSMSDVLATSVVLVAMIILAVFGVNVDGIGGVLVACFILYTGFASAKDTLSPLLGSAPDPELVQQIESIVMERDEVVGIHDMVIHDYGPGRMIVSLHAEVRSDGDLFALHDAIDLAERELAKKLGCEAVIHMDPLAVDNEAVNSMKRAVFAKLSERWPGISIHDFRMVTGPTHTNLIFDAVVPASCKESDCDVQASMEKLIDENFPNHYAVIKVDRSYVM